MVICLAFMGVGGLISIVGGFLFLYVCYRAMWPKFGRLRAVSSS